jgi:hypothetical protein
MRSLFLLLLALPLGAQPAPDFVRDIQPILTQRCLTCHGARMQMAGLRLDDKTSAQKVIANGLLIRKVSGVEKTVMPPIGAPLSAAQIATLQRWVDAGANWPASANFTKHWAFEPIRRPAIPSVANSRWPANDIDRFVLARLEKEGVQPSPEADRHTLVRRLTLDLTGLPPTPAETAAFLADRRPDAYERVVDRLLASPHYGEKWARYWLDLAHYADSDGYEKDLVRPNAWVYRQWVIEALNKDLPYDRFTIQQIAGDELPNASTEEKVATGFFRNTLTNREAGVDRDEARFEQLVDRTGTLGTTWLGLTVRCAQCHDHKYDPILHRDYYQIMAFFNASEETEIDAPMPGELAPYLRSLPEHDKQRAAILIEYGVEPLQRQWEQDILRTMRDSGKNLDWDFEVTGFRAAFDRANKVIASEPDRRRPKDQLRLTRYFLAHIGPVFNKDKETAARLKTARDKLDKLDTEFPQPAEAPVMEDDAAAPTTFIHLRGDYKQNGAEVQPDAPHFLPPMQHTGPANRLALAQWIVAPENPLTARVAVNRFWQELFGPGIVTTSDDFGTQGDKPSHPELLDWLSTEFRSRDWSMKQIVKLMVMSSAYRQSSQVRPDLQERDPANILIARQSRLRLPAESIRDEALAAGGLLNLAIGGRSVRPPQPAGVAELGYGNSVKWKESTGADRYRRGLYIHYQRTTPYPFLNNFDEPDSDIACTRRRTSDTPLQALNLLNDPVFFEAAQALAARVQQEGGPTFDTRLDYLFALCLNRKPDAHERERLAAFYKVSDWLGLSRVMLNLDEFITRE